LQFAVTLAIAASWTIPTSALAVARCADPDFENWFDGMKTGYSPVYSARGSIVDMPILMCSQVSTSGGSTWVMVAGGDPLGFEYAQVGFARLPGMSTPSRFTEYNDGEGYTRTFWSGYSINTNHFYEVLFSFGGPPRKLTMKADGNVLAVTPWSPEGGEWHVGWTGQFMGETLDRGDDVSGTPADHENFTGLKVIKTWGGGWVVPPNPLVVQDFLFYQGAWVQIPDYFDIWTQR
jgi:hypothetical protein